MYSYDEIRTVHLEITQRCQAACPMCDRNMNGGDDNPHMTDAELSVEDCQKIFSVPFIQQLKTMYMCGNLGDPIVAKDTLEVFEYFRKHNPKMWLSMNTNAGAQKEEWWERLANIYGRMGTVIFSVDGLRDTNHLYRQNVNWDIVERSMRAFIGAGGRARWDFLIFEHNEHQVEEAEMLANELGFERFTKKKSGRFISSATSKAKEEHQAVNRKGQETQNLAKPTSEEYKNKALLKQEQIVKQYGSMLDYYNSCKIDCKVASEEKSIFITAEGLLMPCCWTAGRMYKWWHKDYKVEQVWDFIDQAGGKKGIDVINSRLSDVINNSGLLQNITNSWELDSLPNGKLGVCAQKCGTEFDPFGEQFI